MTPEWIRRKAGAYQVGWANVFHITPTIPNVVKGLAVAAYETIAGDAWKGPDQQLGTDDDERNWGACTFRPLNEAEYRALAGAVQAAITRAGLPPRGTIVWAGKGIYAWRRTTGAGKTETLLLNAAEQVHASLYTPFVGKGHEARAQAAQAAIVAAGMPIPSGTLLGQFVRRCAIHCDSAPSIGPYFTWFASFDSDSEGAEYFVRLLCLRRDGTFKMAKGVLERESSTEHDLAAAMYAAGYFTGTHKPASTSPEDKRSADEQNIETYASALRKRTPTIRAALMATPATAIELPPTIRLGSKGPAVQKWQRTVGVLPTGDFDRETFDATKPWQKKNGLNPDGVVGPKTWAIALGRPPPPAAA